MKINTLQIVLILPPKATLFAVFKGWDRDSKRQDHDQITNPQGQGQNQVSRQIPKTKSNSRQQTYANKSNCLGLEGRHQDGKDETKAKTKTLTLKTRPRPGH